MLPGTCQHENVWDCQLLLFFKKVWDFPVADKDLERWILKPIWIYNLLFNQSQDFGITQVIKIIFPHIYLSSFSQQGGKKERNPQTELFISMWAVQGKGWLLRFLPPHYPDTHKGHAQFGSRAEPIMVAIYWKTWWNKILKVDNAWCSELIKIHFCSWNSMNWNALPSSEIHKY